MVSHRIPISGIQAVPPPLHEQHQQHHLPRHPPNPHHNPIHHHHHQIRHPYHPRRRHRCCLRVSTILRLCLLCVVAVYIQAGLRTYQEEIVHGVETTARYLNIPTGRRRRRSPAPPVEFRILCTSGKGRVQWGSYKLRCKDWHDWAKKCARRVRITIGTPIESFYPPPKKKKKKKKWGSSRWKHGGDNSQTNDSSNNSHIDNNTTIDTSLASSSRPLPKPPSHFNATVSVKAVPRTPIPARLGTVYVDLVDDYTVTDKRIPPEVRLILQTERQGKERFRSRNGTSVVVEHWYNSYPDDMFRDDPDPDDGGVPPIRNLGDGGGGMGVGRNLNNQHNDNNEDDDEDDKNRLRIATIWNTLAADTGGGCPSVANISDVRYDCIEQDFDILDWYGTVDRSPDSAAVVERYMNHSGWGTGRLYYHLFRKYDVLVVLAKNHTIKLRYGNVQRAVSQMRSGVPVLLEVWGDVAEDFMERYGYKCAFARHNTTGKFRIRTPGKGGENGKMSVMTKESFWTWEQAVEELKKPEVRRECQRQGLEIAKDYSPTTLGKKFLRAVGYNGPFDC